VDKAEVLILGRLVSGFYHCQAIVSLAAAGKLQRIGRSPGVILGDSRTDLPEDPRVTAGFDSVICWILGIGDGRVK
jgi:hypothetical protein